jgi:thiol-disulfide isomerase/thioredoxin
MLRSPTLIVLTAALYGCGTPPAGHPAPSRTAADASTAVRMTVGDPAPPIDISNWLQGEKVMAFEPGHVYVLEFWATWCGPCRMSMPHLSELQKLYRDRGVTIIGVSGEKPQVVTAFLQTTGKDGTAWKDKICYTLATDPDGSVKADYFTAAGRRGIPSAFIIGKDGKVEWIGHPMAMDDPLAQVVNDS